MTSPNHIEQQSEYLRHRATRIASFAREQHARQGRGVIVLEWPMPDFMKLEEVLDYSIYLPQESLKLAGWDAAENLVRAVRQYNPAQQAIVICIENLGRSFNVHLLTAVYGYLIPVRDTNH
ncbi:MAG TPA: hypothetical protein VJ302_06425 [Blastocatellia bacterium]|nr:hypothetical protein [Blastocatellia bacterium]